jgi:hypothetical protein
VHSVFAPSVQELSEHFLRLSLEVSVRSVNEVPSSFQIRMTMPSAWERSI